MRVDLTAHPYPGRDRRSVSLPARAEAGYLLRLAGGWPGPSGRVGMARVHGMSVTAEGSEGGEPRGGGPPPHGIGLYRAVA